MLLKNKYPGLPVALIIIAVATLVVKFILVPFAQTTDADAVSRTLDAMQWMQHPRWIIQSVWGPFDFYLNGLVLMLWNNPVNALIVFHIVLSVLTLIPFFFFVRREFTEFGAIVATAFLAISPILFRSSLMALSETPYLLFIVMCLNFISKGIKEGKNSYLLWAGMVTTIASGFRYEAWLMIAIFSLLVLLLGGWKKAFLFGAVACIFPFTSMLQNYLLNGQPLYGIVGNYNWTINVMQNNAHPAFEDYLRRIWSFPFSWMIALGPLTAWVTIRSIFLSYKKSNKWHSVWMWTIPFWLFFFTMQYNAFKGTLILHHRFIGTLVILSLPFSAAYFDVRAVSKVRQALIFGALTIGLTFVYNTGNVIYLPRLHDQEAVKTANFIKQQLNRQSGLIADNWGWQNTYYIALQSGLQWSNMMLLDDRQDNQVPVQSVNKLLSNYPQGIIVLVKNSALSHNVLLKDSLLTFSFNDMRFVAKTVYRNDTVTVLKYNHLID